uniref:SRRM_C domain-containing protein n=1 Tax=Mesocestoides corti TaxID=53468 RepID=A0A5K3FRX8_MESCO
IHRTQDPLRAIARKNTDVTVVSTTPTYSNTTFPLVRAKRNICCVHWNRHSVSVVLFCLDDYTKRKSRKCPLLTMTSK